MSDENTTKSMENRENNVSERYSENIEMVLFVRRNMQFQFSKSNGSHIVMSRTNLINIECILSKLGYKPDDFNRYHFTLIACDVPPCGFAFARLLSKCNKFCCASYSCSVDGVAWNFNFCYSGLLDLFGGIPNYICVKRV